MESPGYDGTVQIVGGSFQHALLFGRAGRRIGGELCRW